MATPTEIQDTNSYEYWRQRYNELVEWVVPGTSESIFQTVPTVGAVPYGDADGQFSSEWVKFNTFSLRSLFDYTDTEEDPTLFTARSGEDDDPNPTTLNIGFILDGGQPAWRIESRVNTTGKKLLLNTLYAGGVEMGGTLEVADAISQGTANDEDPVIDQIIVTDGDDVFRKASIAHFGTEITPHLESATTTAEGIVELAIAAEVTTGTDNTRAITPLALAGGTVGWQIGYAVTSSTTIDNTALVIPFDNTAPQDSEGKEYSVLNTAYTPKFSSSLIEIEAYLPILDGANENVLLALFQSSVSSALVACRVDMSAAAAGQPTEARIRVTVAAGSTAARTYSLRFGSEAGADVSIGAVAGGGSSIFDTARVASMTVKEIKQ